MGVPAGACLGAGVWVASLRVAAVVLELVEVFFGFFVVVVDDDEGVVDVIWLGGT